MKGLETTMETKKFCQAPTLVNIGKGYRPSDWKNYGNNVIDGYLAQKICEACGAQMGAREVLRFFIGCADGFKIAEKTVCERCNIDERTYRRARKFLQENNFILVYGGMIEVNYEAIYNFKKPEEKPVEAKQEQKDMDDYFAHSAW